MAIFKKGITQAQKSKSIIIIIVMAVLFSIPIYNIGKKLFSSVGSSKPPVLACTIDGYNMTFDLRKYTPWEKAKKKSKLPRLLLMKVADDVYHFTNRVRNDDGTQQYYRWWVNRYTGIIDGEISYAWIKGEKNSMKKMLSTQNTFNGTCKGAK